MKAVLMSMGLGVIWFKVIVLVNYVWVIYL